MEHLIPDNLSVSVSLWVLAVIQPVSKEVSMARLSLPEQLTLLQSPGHVRSQHYQPVQRVLTGIQIAHILQVVPGHVQ